MKNNLFNKDYIEDKINQLEVELMTTNNFNKFLLWSYLLLIALSILVIIFNKESGFNYAITMIVVCIILIIALLTSKKNKIIEKKINFYKKKLEEVSDESYYDTLVKINLNNLSEYYFDVKMSHKKIFDIALFASIFGLIIILIGVIRGMNEPNSIKILGVVAGIIIEGISGLLFYLYNKEVSQFKSYHDKLIDVQNILLAFKIIEEVEKDKKSEVLKQMIDGLITRK